MGWLFGRKKKIPQVPFPEPGVLEEGSLRFPSSMGAPKVIEPNKFKEAAGVHEPLPVPRPPSTNQPPQRPLLVTKPSLQKQEHLAPVKRIVRPLHIKMETYQRILWELDGLKDDISQLHTTNTRLLNSEYNEDESFAKLRRSIRAMHDNLQEVDKTLFNRQGEKNG
jgi:hypothetical protein